MSKYHAHRAAQEQYENKDDDSRDPDAVRRTDQHATQDGLQRGRESPGEHDGEEPGDDRDGFAEQAPYQAHGGGNDDDGEDDVVDCDHSMSQAATPSKQAPHCTRRFPAYAAK